MKEKLDYLVYSEPVEEPEIELVSVKLKMPLYIREKATKQSADLGVVEEDTVQYITEQKNNYGKLAFDEGWISLLPEHVDFI